MSLQTISGTLNSKVRPPTKDEVLLPIIFDPSDSKIDGHCNPSEVLQDFAAQRL